MGRTFQALLLPWIWCAVANAQPTPQQIRQHQMDEERTLQLDQEQRDRQQHDAQMEKMREIDRQQAEDARQAAEKARAQAIATQQNLYLLQQEELMKEQAQAKAKAQAGDQGVRPQPRVQPQQTAASAMPVSPPTASAQPPARPAAHWSVSNMTTRDKAGIAGLGVLLIVLAYAAGIIPAFGSRR